MEGVGPSPYNLDLSMHYFHVFSPLKKMLRGRIFRFDKICQGHIGTVVPAAAKGAVWRGLTASTPMGTILNGLYSFTQSNPQVDSTSTSLIP
jgi:hypothetical protein